MRKPKARKIIGRLANGKKVESAWNKKRRLAEQRLIDFVWSNATLTERSQLLEDMRTIKGPWEYW